MQIEYSNYHKENASDKAVYYKTIVKDFPDSYCNPQP